MNASTSRALSAGAVVGILVALVSIILDWGWGATAAILALVVVLGVGVIAVGSRSGRGGTAA